MPTFVVTGGPIDHDAQRYQLHDEIELTDQQAVQLLALGEVAAKAPTKVAAKAAKRSRVRDGEGPQE